MGRGHRYQPVGSNSHKQHVANTNNNSCCCLWFPKARLLQFQLAVLAVLLVVLVLLIRSLPPQTRLHWHEVSGGSSGPGSGAGGTGVGTYMAEVMLGWFSGGKSSDEEEVVVGNCSIDNSSTSNSSRSDTNSSSDNANNTNINITYSNNCTTALLQGKELSLESTAQPDINERNNSTKARNSAGRRVRNQRVIQIPAKTLDTTSGQDFIRAKRQIPPGPRKRRKRRKSSSLGHRNRREDEMGVGRSQV